MGVNPAMQMWPAVSHLPRCVIRIMLKKLVIEHTSSYCGRYVRAQVWHVTMYGGNPYR
jgi:hypothetical protein